VDREEVFAGVFSGHESDRLPLQRKKDAGNVSMGQKGGRKEGETHASRVLLEKTRSVVHWQQGDESVCDPAFTGKKTLRPTFSVDDKPGLVGRVVSLQLVYGDRPFDRVVRHLHLDLLLQLNNRCRHVLELRLKNVSTLVLEPLHPTAGQNTSLSGVLESEGTCNVRVDGDSEPRVVHHSERDDGSVSGGRGERIMVDSRGRVEVHCQGEGMQRQAKDEGRLSELGERTVPRLQSQTLVHRSNHDLTRTLELLDRRLERPKTPTEGLLSVRQVERAVNRVRVGDLSVEVLRAARTDKRKSAHVNLRTKGEGLTR
jgi:hypothetical protein